MNDTSQTTGQKPLKTKPKTQINCFINRILHLQQGPQSKAMLALAAHNIPLHC